MNAGKGILHVRVACIGQLTDFVLLFAKEAHVRLLVDNTQKKGLRLAVGLETRSGVPKGIDAFVITNVLQNDCVHRVNRFEV